MGKHDSSNQMKINNQIAQQQLALQNQRLADYVSTYLKPVVAGGGYLPGVKQALTSTALQQIPGAYQDIAQQLQRSAAARGLAGGGTLPGGGGYLRDYGNLLSQEELAKSNALNQITAQGQQNIAAAEQGGLQAAGIYSGAGQNALGNATNAANASTQASTGLLGSIVGGGLGVLGSAIGQGGIWGQKVPPCWVAAELYGGWETPETISIRAWLLKTWWMQPFVALYREIGPSWAEWIHRHSFPRKLTKLLFDWFLRLSNG